MGLLKGNFSFARFHVEGQLPQAFLNEITHFFQEYKKLEGKTTEILGWENAQKAMESIEYSMKLFKEIE